MAELIAGLVEAFIGLISAFLRTLLWIAPVCVTIIAYLVSPKFRARKQKEWKQRPTRKYSDLAISGVCVAAVIVLSVWLVLPEKKKPGTLDHLEVQKGEVGEDLRFVIGTDSTNRLEFAVKAGGITNIFGTRILSQLSNAIRQTVSLIDREDDASNGSRQTQLPR
jgi:hypothetical protein